MNFCFILDVWKSKAENLMDLRQSVIAQNLSWISNMLSYKQLVTQDIGFHLLTLKTTTTNTQLHKQIVGEGTKREEEKPRKKSRKQDRVLPVLWRESESNSAAGARFQ